MESIIYERIKTLCSNNGITIAKLESILGFGNSSIKKWEKSSSPSIDKIVKVATYFDVTVDYLLGRTDIKCSASEIISDKDMISLQRARENMSQQDRDRMMQMLKLGFNHAFSEEDDKPDD